MEMRASGAPGRVPRFVLLLTRNRGAWTVFLADCLIMFGSLVVLIDAGLRTDSAPRGMMSLASAASRETARRIIQDWRLAEPAPLVQDALRYLGFDLLFLVSFFALVALGCFWLTDRLGEEVGSGGAMIRLLGRVIGWLQLPAALLDLVEDLALFLQLQGGASSRLASLAYRSNQGKLLLAGLGLGVILISALLLLWFVQKRFPLLQYLWHCRFPLLTGGVLLGLGPFAVLGLPILLRNTFAVSGAGLAVITAVTIAAALTAFVALRNILLYGSQRFDLAELPPWASGWITSYGRRLTFWLILPVLTTAIVISEGPWALIWVCLAISLALTLRHRKVAREAQSRQAGPESGGRESSPIRDTGYFPGYFTEEGRLLDGHVKATGFLLLSFGVYLALAFPLLPDPDDPGLHFPTLAYLLMLITIGAWILPGVSFFLDRFRIPTTLAIIVFVLVSIWDADHYYDVFPRPQNSPPVLSPEAAFDVMEAPTGSNMKPAVVVAASGGGITASLWTAHVLTQLQLHPDLSNELVRSIRVMSTASGGTLGAMHYLDAFTPAGFPSPESASEIVGHASAPALDTLAWGIVYLDIWRGLIPGLFHLGILDQAMDRGWALETGWKRELAQPHKRLSDWLEAVRAGWMPPAIFNATVVQTGGQYVFTPLHVPEHWQAESLFQKEPAQDIAIATAARLSSTFPWASPIARARLQTVNGAGLSERFPEGGHHLADGGYYDNFGVVSAINWIETVASSRLLEFQKKGVILILIDASSALADDQATTVELEEPQDKGWIYATVGPLVTLVKVLFSSQLHRNTLEVDLLKKRWAKQGVPVASFWFRVNAPAPLSWQLTPDEITAIKSAWQSPSNTENLRELVDCFQAIGECPPENIAPQ